MVWYTPVHSGLACMLGLGCVVFLDEQWVGDVQPVGYLCAVGLNVL